MLLDDERTPAEEARDFAKRHNEDPDARPPGPDLDCDERLGHVDMRGKRIPSAVPANSGHPNPAHVGRPKSDYEIMEDISKEAGDGNGELGSRTTDSRRRTGASGRAKERDTK
jgi:hypothetical protein